MILLSIKVYFACPIAIIESTPNISASNKSASYS